jgi:hypothetical protein
MNVTRQEARLIAALEKGESVAVVRHGKGKVK